MAEEQHPPHWFWRVFGPTLLGALVVLVGVILNYSISNFLELRAEILKNSKEISTVTGKVQAVEDARTPLVNEFRTNISAQGNDIATIINKLNSLDQKFTPIWNNIKVIEAKVIILEQNKDKSAIIEQQINAFKEELKNINIEFNKMKERIIILEQKK